MSFDSDLIDFYSYLEAERRYSSHTLAAYRRDLNAFTGFSRQRDVNSWKQMDDLHVRAFVASQHRKGLSGTSLQRQLSSIRTLFRFCWLSRWMRRQ